MNTDILNGKPFSDKNLTTTISRLERETASITTIPYTTFANPTTTERTLILTEGQVAAEKLYCTVDALVNLTSAVAGDQDFTFKLYLGPTVLATSVVMIPDALNTLVSVRLEGVLMYSRLNSTALEYIGALKATPLATSASASVSTVTVVDTQNPIEVYADLAGNFNLKLTCTAETGTATTTITVMGGRATFDKSN